MCFACAGEDRVAEDCAGDAGRSAREEVRARERDVDEDEVADLRDSEVEAAHSSMLVGEDEGWKVDRSAGEEEAALGSSIEMRASQVTMESGGSEAILKEEMDCESASTEELESLLLARTDVMAKERMRPFVLELDTLCWCDTLELDCLNKNEH